MATSPVIERCGRSEIRFLEARLYLRLMNLDNGNMKNRQSSARLVRHPELKKTVAGNDE